MATRVSHLSPGGVLGKAELPSVSSPSSSPFPKSVCAQKQIIQLLKMQPRHLSQPEHLIFYRLKCMQIGLSPREHPQGARGWELGSESVAVDEKRSGGGQQQGSGRFPSRDDLPFPHSPSLFLCWFQMAENSPPPAPRWLIVMKKLREGRGTEYHLLDTSPPPSPSLPYSPKCVGEKGSPWLDLMLTTQLIPGQL